LAGDGVKVVAVVWVAAAVAAAAAIVVAVGVAAEEAVVKILVIVVVFVVTALSDACFSISASIRCLRILDSTPSKLVVFFLALPLGPPSPVLLGVNFGADISSIKSKSDFSSGL
jgi:hypothetical protein